MSESRLVPSNEKTGTETQTSISVSAVVSETNHDFLEQLGVIKNASDGISETLAKLGYRVDYRGPSKFANIVNYVQTLVRSNPTPDLFQDTFQDIFEAILIDIISVNVTIPDLHAFITRQNEKLDSILHRLSALEKPSVSVDTGTQYHHSSCESLPTGDIGETESDPEPSVQPVVEEEISVEDALLDKQAMMDSAERRTARLEQARMKEIIAYLFSMLTDHQTTLPEYISKTIPKYGDRPTIGEGEVLDTKKKKVKVKDKKKTKKKPEEKLIRWSDEYVAAIQDWLKSFNIPLLSLDLSKMSTGEIFRKTDELFICEIISESKESFLLKQFLFEEKFNEEIGKWTQRMMRDAGALSILNKIPHPNIVRSIGVIVDQKTKTISIIQPFIIGGTLEKALSEKKIHGFKQMLHIFLDIAIATNHLHTYGIMHRDIKSSNVLLTDTGAVLCDPELMGPVQVKLNKEKQYDNRGCEIITPPELQGNVKDGKNPDIETFAADIYAFGLLMWEVLTGTIPFKGLSKDFGKHAVRAIKAGKFPNFPEQEFPYSLLTFLMKKCLSKNPEERPTALEVVHSLEEKKTYFEKFSSSHLLRRRSLSVDVQSIRSRSSSPATSTGPSPLAGSTTSSPTSSCPPSPDNMSNQTLWKTSSEKMVSTSSKTQPMVACSSAPEIKMQSHTTSSLIVHSLFSAADRDTLLTPAIGSQNRLE